MNLYRNMYKTNSALDVHIYVERALAHPFPAPSSPASPPFPQIPPLFHLPLSFFLSLPPNHRYELLHLRACLKTDLL